MSPRLSARLRGRWSRRIGREGAARSLRRSLALVALARPVRTGGQRRSALAQHPVSSSHLGHPTPGWELQVLGTGAGERRAAVTELCSHEGAASDLALSLAWGTVAIPEGRSQGQPPPQSEVRGAPRPQTCPPAPPSLACHPYLAGDLTPLGRGRGSRRLVRTHAQRWEGLGSAWRLTAVGPGMKASSCLSRCCPLRKDSDAYRLSSTCPVSIECLRLPYTFRNNPCL